MCALQLARFSGSAELDRWTTCAVLTGMSRRHLERRFQEVVGLSPKRFARITRFQHALRIFEQGASGQRGAATAAACGYADQAHFIRDFGELAGCSPEAHLLRNAMLNRLFAEPYCNPQKDPDSSEYPALTGQDVVSGFQPDHASPPERLHEVRLNADTTKTCNPLYFSFIPPSTNALSMSGGSFVPARAFALRIRSGVTPWSRSVTSSSTGRPV